MQTKINKKYKEFISKIKVNIEKKSIINCAEMGQSFHYQVLEWWSWITDLYLLKDILKITNNDPCIVLIGMQHIENINQFIGDHLKFKYINNDFRDPRNCLLLTEGL